VRSTSYEAPHYAIFSTLLRLGLPSGLLPSDSINIQAAYVFFRVLFNVGFSTEIIHDRMVGQQMNDELERIAKEKVAV
jgi:hypothetical protein